MGRKDSDSASEIQHRLRAAMCDVAADGFDLDGHARHIAAVVAAKKAPERPGGDLVDEEMERVRVRMTEERERRARRRTC